MILFQFSCLCSVYADQSNLSSKSAVSIKKTTDTVKTAVKEVVAVPLFMHTVACSELASFCMKVNYDIFLSLSRSDEMQLLPTVPD